MNIIKPSTETIAEALCEKIKPLSEQNILLSKTITEVLNTADNWLILTNHSGGITGFCEYRDHSNEAERRSEMGSVVSLEKGVGKILLQQFNTLDQVQNTLRFAITKDHRTAEGFFQKNNENAIIFSEKEIPNWFERVTHDRYMISWK